MSVSVSRRDLLQAAAAAPAAAQSSPMPQVRLGRYSISRLICGSNPFFAGSHLSVFFNIELKRYFTPEQVVKTLGRCQEVGINTFQASGEGSFNLYRRFIDGGGKMHFLSLEWDKPELLPKLAKGGCIGVAHHGEFTDRAFKQGKIDTIHDFLKKTRDAGLLVGVSTHMPAVVDVIESKGWDVDYYMTCVYERHRTAAELEALLGQAPIPVGEVYLPKDPPRMYKVIQQTRRTCLAFKILAAGRLSERREWVEEAFRETYANIKPGDAVILGMVDKYTDQPGESAELVRRYGGVSA